MAAIEPSLGSLAEFPRLLSRASASAPRPVGGDMKDGPSAPSEGLPALLAAGQFLGQDQQDFAVGVHNPTQ